jgi:hypothetical protein
MTLSNRLNRLEVRAGLHEVVASDPQVLIVDQDDARKTNEPVDHNASIRYVLWDSGRDSVDLRIWGDPAFAIDWAASDDEQEAQIARQRAHLGLSD